MLDTHASWFEDGCSWDDHGSSIRQKRTANIGGIV